MMLLIRTIALLTSVAVDPNDDAVDYLRDVRPVLERRCISCHGTLQQKGGLRLDTAHAILAGGDSGPSVVSEDATASLLIEKVTASDPMQRMPPEGEPLTAVEIAALRTWISAGAAAPEGETPPKDPRDHWSYRTPVRPSVPASSAAFSNPIDAFLDAARHSQGLTASPPVSRDLWLRRVALDLVGLPPTRAETQAFRDDSTEKALEDTVDRLLASPAYGERWARHWMDIWRYSDWYGLGEEMRFSHYHIWRWRDWIIESLNAGTGYDQMIIAMLAADEIAPEDPNTLRATGFLVRSYDTFSRNKWLDMTIEHTSRAFLGVTLQCARCHDHKFDPIAQTDYYRMRAVFEPSQIRIDRVPGQPDRAKDGVARSFDDYLDTPTHLFVRGDETLPETSQSLSAGTPPVLGGTFNVQPVALPMAAYNPDKQAFVIEEARSSAERGVAVAVEGVKSARAAQEQAFQAQIAAEESLRQAEQALQSPMAPEDLAKARSAVVVTTETWIRARSTVKEASNAKRRADAIESVARRTQQALTAVLDVERLEDEGFKESNPVVWAEAARCAMAEQREQALAEAVIAELVEQETVERATAVIDGLIAAAVDPKDESLKASLAASTSALVDARAKLAAAGNRRKAVEADCDQPPTTDYKPRALQFPRAKVTYRDTPGNAPYSKTSTGRRLALARWITDRSNPLTARVAVNHIWTRHFGEPLVRSVFDFGLRTPQPVHHDLLDWLAVEFMESGWDMKHIHRLIVTSAAYRMTSSVRSDGEEMRRREGETGREGDEKKPSVRSPSLPVSPSLPRSVALADPDNHYYWRMNPRRMEAEVIRDSLLHLAGRLDTTRGGHDLPVAAAEEGLRRTIYYRYTRDDRMLFLAMFDPASTEECYRRHETIVPQQALALYNSKLVLDRADEIAGKISAEVRDGSTGDFVSAAFELLLGRMPTEAEMVAAIDGLDRLTEVENTESADTTGAASTEPEENPRATVQTAVTPRDRARAAFIHVLINHNDFVTIR